MKKNSPTIRDVAAAAGVSVATVSKYINGAQRTLLFRVRYGSDMASRHVTWRGREGWKQRPEDVAYYRQHPVGA